MEGKVIPVMCYTDFPEAELFVDDISFVTANLPMQC